MTIKICLIVAIIWSITNNLIKHYSVKSSEISERNQNKQTLSEKIYSYIKNYKLTLSFLANQAGSVLFTLSLGDKDISKFIPTVNALTILFTFVFDWNIKIADKLRLKKISGISCILVGTYLLS